VRNQLLLPVPDAGLQLSVDDWFIPHWYLPEKPPQPRQVWCSQGQAKHVLEHSEGSNEWGFRLENPSLSSLFLSLQ
jgi:hypothetical protein